jgi:hypothetical protein
VPSGGRLAWWRRPRLGQLATPPPRAVRGAGRRRAAARAARASAAAAGGAARHSATPVAPGWPRAVESAGVPPPASPHPSGEGALRWPRGWPHFDHAAGPARPLRSSRAPRGGSSRAMVAMR